MSTNDGALSGLKVIDCATYVAGPAAATVMSDFGADVIKIERPPDGDLWRTFPSIAGYPNSDLSYTWILTSRNKRSIALDLSQAPGRAALLSIVAGADVFVTNYQHSLLKKFEITWEDLRPLNPRLIYAHITGYGDRGEDADSPAFDGLAYWARSGLMTSVTGADRTPASARPAMGDHPTAMTLFAAIMLGLYRRERTGIGSRVSTSLMAAGAWANSVDLQAQLCGARFPVRKPGDRPINPLIAAYPSSDGHAMIIALLDPVREFPRLCAALGEPELADNPLFATAEARGQNAAALYAILQSQFETQPLREWRRLFREHDIKWSPLPTLEEAARDQQMRDCGAIIDFDFPGVGHFETIDSPLFVAESPKRTPQPPPGFGMYTREILREAGYSEKEVDHLIEIGAADARDRK
ncbi:MAG TPA: CoA transferase [Candidatus Binataceae bacterium]|nr:CoA transferase [Candidatus Binataceae bacterium]